MIRRRDLLGSAILLTGCGRGGGILEAPSPKADSRIAYGPDPNQFGDLRVPSGAGPHPVVIFLHGGFWLQEYDLNHAGAACKAITQEGFATWSLEYRRLGQSGGGYPGTFNDVKLGTKHLSEIAAAHKLDLRRVIVSGHSAGGQLALWLAKQNAVNLLSVIALAAVSDLKLAWQLKLSNGVVDRLLGGSPDSVPERYASCSPIQMLPIPVPQRMVHGDGDDVVPYEMSATFAKTSKNAVLRPIRGAGHFDLIDPRSAAWPFVRDSFKAALTTSGRGEL